MTCDLLAQEDPSKLIANGLYGNIKSKMFLYFFSLFCSPPFLNISLHPSSSFPLCLASPPLQLLKTVLTTNNTFDKFPCLYSEAVLIV